MCVCVCLHFLGSLTVVEFCFVFVFLCTFASYLIALLPPKNRNEYGDDDSDDDDGTTSRRGGCGRGGGRSGARDDGGRSDVRDGGGRGRGGAATRDGSSPTLSKKSGGRGEGTRAVTFEKPEKKTKQEKTTKKAGSGDGDAGTGRRGGGKASGGGGSGEAAKSAVSVRSIGVQTVAASDADDGSRGRGGGGGDDGGSGGGGGGRGGGGGGGGGTSDMAPLGKVVWRLGTTARMGSSWSLVKIKKGAVKQKLKIGTVLNLIADCYEKKIPADIVDDSQNHERQPMDEFVSFFLLTKFGLQNMKSGAYYLCLQYKPGSLSSYRFSCTCFAVHILCSGGSRYRARRRFSLLFARCFVISGVCCRVATPRASPMYDPRVLGCEPLVISTKNIWQLRNVRACMQRTRRRSSLRSRNITSSHRGWSSSGS